MATEETSNDAKKAGGYLKEKAGILASRWNNDEVERAILKVTSHKLKVPNEKHMARLVQATHGNYNAGDKVYDDVNGFIVDELVPHTHTHNWIVVLKTLLTFHTLLTEGSDDVVVRITNARQAFNTQHMKDLADSPDGAAQMALIHNYARYLEEKCVTTIVCRAYPRIETPRFADDFCSASPEAAAPVADALLLQMEALLEFEFRPIALNNFASLEAYKRTLADGKRIYVILTRRIAGMLEGFRSYPTPMKKAWISIYKRYAAMVKGLAATFDLVNSNTNVVFGEVYPTIKTMPEGVLLQLQDDLLAEEIPVVKLSSVLSGGGAAAPVAAPAGVAGARSTTGMTPAEAAAAAVASGVAAVQSRSKSPDLFRRASPPQQQQQAPPPVEEPPKPAPKYASPPTQTAHPANVFEYQAQSAPPPQPPQPQRNVIDDLFGGSAAAQPVPQQQQYHPQQQAALSTAALFAPQPTAAPPAPAPVPQFFAPAPTAPSHQPPATAFDPFAPTAAPPVWGAAQTAPAPQYYGSHATITTAAPRGSAADFDPFAPVQPAGAATQGRPVDFFSGASTSSPAAQSPASSRPVQQGAGGASSAEAQLDFFAQAQQQPNRRSW